MKRIVALLVVALAACTAVPLIWIEDLAIDWEQLTEEWYKECARIGEILLAFVLVHVLWERQKRLKAEEERKAKREEHYRRREDACKDYTLGRAALLRGSTGGDADALGAAGQLLGSAWDKFEDLAADVEKAGPDEASQRVREWFKWYRTRPDRDLARLVNGVEEGRIVPMRPLDPEDEAAIGRLESFVSGLKEDDGQSQERDKR